MKSDVVTNASACVEAANSTEVFLTVADNVGCLSVIVNLVVLTYVLPSFA